MTLVLFLAITLVTDNDIWMQDGAPPHFGRNVRDFLENTFEMWIGRRGTIDWPQRSPDLTPCEYSMWGILKERIYSQNVQTIPELKERITSEFAALNNDKDLCRRICVTLFREESSCVLILKDNTLKIRCTCNCFHVFVLKSLFYDD